MKDRIKRVLLIAWYAFTSGLTIMLLFYGCGGYKILRDHFEPTVEHDTVFVHDTISLPVNYKDIVSYQKNVRRGKFALLQVISDIRGIDPFEQSPEGMSRYLLKVRKSLERLKKQLDVTDSLGNIYNEGYFDGYGDGHDAGYEEGHNDALMEE